MKKEIKKTYLLTVTNIKIKIVEITIKKIVNLFSYKRQFSITNSTAMNIFLYAHKNLSALSV